MPSAEREFVLDNTLAQIPRFAEEIEAFCQLRGVAPADIYKINLALEELLTNIISYGFDDDRVHRIQVVLALQGEQFQVMLSDDGKPFDPLSEAGAAVLEGRLEDRPIGGLGVHLVRTLMDRLEYAHVDGHNRLTLHKRVRLQQAPGASSAQG